MRKLKGSFTIEAAFVIPLILLLFVILMYLFFYYHDKNVLIAGVQEAAVYGCGRSLPTEHEIGEFLTNQVEDRLLLFSEIKQEIQLEKDEILIRCWSTTRGMSMEANVRHSRIEPEQFIRNLRKIEKLGEKVDEVVKDTDQE